MGNVIWDSLRQGVGRLCGPVLEKELRVQGRQGRPYWVRSGYVLFLLMMVWGQWLDLRLHQPVSRWDTDVTTQLARWVVNRIVWMQFIVAHVLAAVNLGNGLSREIRTRSLAVLMTSPLRGIHLVWGKLLAGSLLPWSLLLLSGPVLAMIRVWGGVQWHYIWVSMLVDGMAVIWIGALSLFVSLWLRRAHHVVMVVLLATIATYAACEMILRWGLDQPTFSDWWLVWCPYGVQKLLAMDFQQPGLLSEPLWPRYVALLAGSTLMVMVATSYCLRRCSLGWSPRSVTYQTRTMRHVPIKRYPVLWRELKGQSPGRNLRRQIPWLILAAGMVGWAWFSAYSAADAKIVRLYSISMTALWFLILLRTSLDAALCVTREKEARSWSVLLATPLSGRAILGQKAWAVIWKNLAGWMALCAAPACYLIAMAERMHGDAALMGRAGLGLVLTTVSLVTILGAGIYWGCRLRTGPGAVEATLASTLFCYGILHYLLGPVVTSRFGAVGYRCCGIVWYGTIAVALWVLNLRYLRRCRCEVAEV